MGNTKPVNMGKGDNTRDDGAPKERIVLLNATIRNEAHLSCRVNQDQHRTSDNVLGGVLGYYVAKWLADLKDKKENQIQSTSSTPLFSISIVINQVNYKLDKCPLRPVRENVLHNHS